MCSLENQQEQKWIHFQMLISSSELFFVNYANLKKEIFVTCDYGNMCFYIKCYALKYICVCQPHLGGFHMPGVYIKFILSSFKMCFCVEIVTEQCSVNP